MKYQRHIDGLRALAVLAVVADHLGYTRLRGGFVGVDVFFVISGYLITGIIVSDLDAGRFSLLRFYERRVRRILPALLVMLLTLLAVGYGVLFPSEFADLAKSVMAATASVANIWFWTQTGYFDAPAAQKPLLHTWSLGVEEQFYLLYPFLMMALHRRLGRESLSRSLWGASMVLCAAAAVWTFKDLASAFYLLPARAWELCLGGAVALTPWRKPLPAWLLGAAGLGGILGPVLLYAHETTFPGLAAVPVCVGTAALLLLRDHPDAWAARLLASKPASFFGRISYSLYLWHWPVIVLQRSTNFLHLPDLGVGGMGWHVTRFAEFGVSLVLAVLSYHLVEQPFRRASGPQARKALYGVAMGAAAVAIAVGGVVSTGGLGYRFPSRVIALESYLHYDETSQFRSGECFMSGNMGFDRFPAERCMTYRADRRNVLVMGDSHGAQLWYGLAQALPDVNVMQATATGCRPILAPRDASFAGCHDLIDHVYRKVLPVHKPDLLVIAGRWNSSDLPFLAESLRALHGMGVRTLLVGPAVEYEMPLPRLLAQEVVTGASSYAETRLVRSRFGFDARMEALAKETGTEYFSMIHAVCPGSRCVKFVGDVPLAFDYGHLTAEGSKLIGRWIASRYLGTALPGPSVQAQANAVAAETAAR